MIQNLISGKPPSGKVANQLSKFFSKAVEKMALWCTAAKPAFVPNPETGLCDEGLVTLFGQEAAVSCSRSLHDVASLRRFKWLLSATQQEIVDAWVRTLAQKTAIDYGKQALEYGQLAIEMGSDDHSASSSVSCAASSNSSRKRNCDEMTKSIADDSASEKSAAVTDEMRKKLMSCLF